MSKVVYRISERRAGERAQPDEVIGWMAFVEGWGSPHGMRNFSFFKWAKTTFSRTRCCALRYYRRKWTDWKLVEVKAVRLKKVQLGHNEPMNLDNMCGQSVVDGVAHQR